MLETSLSSALFIAYFASEHKQSLGQFAILFYTGCPTSGVNAVFCLHCELSLEFFASLFWILYPESDLLSYEEKTTTQSAQICIFR